MRLIAVPAASASTVIEKRAALPGRPVRAMQMLPYLVVAQAGGVEGALSTVTSPQTFTAVTT